MVTLKSDLIFSIQTIRNRSNIPLATDHTFFGVTDEYMVMMHKQIFDFLFHSEAGFTFSDLYSIPLSLRNMYFARMSEVMAKREEEIRKTKHRK